MTALAFAEGGRLGKDYQSKVKKSFRFPSCTLLPLELNPAKTSKILFYKWPNGISQYSLTVGNIPSIAVKRLRLDQKVIGNVFTIATVSVFSTGIPRLQ